MGISGTGTPFPHCEYVLSDVVSSPYTTSWFHCQAKPAFHFRANTCRDVSSQSLDFRRIEYCLAHGFVILNVCSDMVRHLCQGSPVVLLL
jgi:hypothetical protein